MYLTLYTFSFEIKESSLSDTRCLIHDVVSPHCGDKRMARLWHDVIALVCEKKHSNWHWWKNGKNNVTSCTKCSLPENIRTNFNSTLVICWKFVFIEMLDKLITYIVWWYKTVYQVLSVAWANRIITRRYRDS